MIIDSATAGGSEWAGTMGLAHSLLRSRLAWIRNAFEALDASSTARPRQSLGTAEVQIGPHLFSDTAFYRIAAPGSEKDPASCPPTLLVIEFADNAGTLLRLPPDLGIDGEGLKASSSQGMDAFFFANPRHPAPRRKPSNIRQDWPHYYSADRMLTRVGVRISEASAELVEALVEYTQTEHVQLCRDYRRALRRPNPTAKYWSAFFPPPHRQALVASATAGLKSTAAKQPPRSADTKKDAAIPARTRVPMEQLREPSVVATDPRPRGGGKRGYNMIVAAALVKQRKQSRVCTGHSDDSDEDEDEDEDEGKAEDEGIAEDEPIHSPLSTQSEPVAPASSSRLKRPTEDSPGCPKPRRVASSGPQERHCQY